MLLVRHKARHQREASSPQNNGMGVGKTPGMWTQKGEQFSDMPRSLNYYYYFMD